MKILRNARAKQTKNTASHGIAIKQLEPNMHVLANFPEQQVFVWPKGWFLNKET
jgi:hypothetical protein